MSNNVPYNKQTLDNPNFFARYSHKKRYKLSLDVVLRNIPNQGSLLDFGCGDGSFLRQLSLQRSSAKLYGFDPESGHIAEGYLAVTDLGDLEAQSQNVITCFETLEHLYPDEKKGFVRDVKRLLRNNGFLIISVPIIGGPTLLLKELNTRLLHKRKSEYSFDELVRASFLGQPAQRPENPRVTHKGFDFRELYDELSNEFNVIERIFSPFKNLPWYLNSQIFIVLSNTKQ